MILHSGVTISCGKCGRETPVEKAFVDRTGLIVRCEHCGATHDRERHRQKTVGDRPPLQNKQLELDL